MLNTYTSIEAEQTILGSLLINSRSLKKIPFLKINDFYDQRNRWLYRTILKIVQKHGYVFIIPTLKSNKKINMFGGMSYFDHLIASIKHTRSFKSYAQLIHHLALSRLKHNNNSPKINKSLPNENKNLRQYQEALLLANLIALGTNQNIKTSSLNPNFNAIIKSLKPSYFKSLPGRTLFKILSRLNHEQIIINWRNIINYLHRYQEYGLINYVSQIMIHSNLSLDVYYLAHSIKTSTLKLKNNQDNYKYVNNNKHNNSKNGLKSRHNNQVSEFERQQLLQNRIPHNKSLKLLKQKAKQEHYSNIQKLKEYRKAIHPNHHVTLTSSIDQLYKISHSDAVRAKYLGINNIHDLLSYFPFRYQNITLKNLKKIKATIKIHTYGKIISDVNIQGSRSNHNKLSFLINLINEHDHIHDKIMVSTYNKKHTNNHQRNSNLNKGDIVSLYGTIKPAMFNASVHPSITAQIITRISTKKIKNSAGNGYIAMYGIYKGSPQHKMTSHKIRHLIYLAYQQCQYLIKNDSSVPQKIQSQYHLEPRKQVIYNLHFPLNKNSLQRAQRTAKFNEFFNFELKLQRNKVKHDHIKGTAIHYHKAVLKRFISHLPYALTKDQINTTKDVLSDLRSHRQMKRLLQGDVGSGKTVVAMIGILATIDSGYQCALMCPTSILAKQHYQSFKEAFKNFDINVDLLIGSLTPKQRSMRLNTLKHGSTNLVIGTSALMQPKIHYYNLAMAVIDEQHRFGVHQRNALKKKGVGVNILSMTATPIPRTMALSSPIYSQLDTSRITHLPGGRKATITKWIKNNNIKKCLSIIKDTLHKREQIFIVVPRIRTNENRYRNNINRLRKALHKIKPSNYKKIKQLNNSLVANHMKLRNQRELNSVIKVKHELGNLLPHTKIGVLDGGMNDSKKNQIMNNFTNNKYQILISTTVVEVGIDISNACLMIIMNADRYGLATLHQLRGRVGRSDKQAYCILLTPIMTLTKSQRKRLNRDIQNVNYKSHQTSSLNIEMKHLKYLKHHGDNGSKRMHIMCSTTDGFKIADADMRLRGSGSLLGQRQSGMPRFKIGNPIDNRHDRNIMYQAERIATRIINKSF